MLKRIFSYLTMPVLAGLLAAVLLIQHERITSLETKLTQEYNPPNATGNTPGFSPAVMKAIPSVVNIYSLKRVREQHRSFFSDPFFDFFFNFGGIPQREKIESSLGSGVIVSKDGYLLTNHHVIYGADKIIVLLHDGRESEARLIGTDPEIDLAVLKVELDDLTPIAFAKLDQAAVGDIVLAIGNPFGLGQTVTQGIISASNRQGLSIASNYIQTDAAINRGNSGGALINTNGNLLGVNTAIYNETGSSVGIGFAIPSDTAMKVLDDIVTHGHVIRGSLGIVPKRVPSRLAKVLGLTEGIGLLISATYRDGPAHLAGIIPGDVITHINGQLITGDQAGLDVIARTTPGKSITISIIRQGKIINLDAIPTQRQS